jgi:hypothetical protein
MNLLNGPCDLCGAPASVRCSLDCPGEARAREVDPADPNAAADLRRRAPTPVRPYSPGLNAILRAQAVREGRG